MLSNNFSFIQLLFVFLLQKDFYFNHDCTDVFFFFLYQKGFYICLGTFFRLFFFFFREIVKKIQKGFRRTLLCEAFLCFSWKYLLALFIHVYKKIIRETLIVINHFYMCTKKVLKNILYASKISFIMWVMLAFSLIIFIKIFYIRISSIRIFSIRIRRNFYIINNILQNLFFFNNIFTWFKKYWIVNYLYLF